MAGNCHRFILEKCDGRLTIENKKKKAMIDELMKKGYDSDPVKYWKQKQDREAVLVSPGIPGILLYGKKKVISREFRP